MNSSTKQTENLENIENIENIKIAILGNSGVGKTCIINRFAKNEFNPETDSTISASYQQKYMLKNGKRYQLDLWDTAGQEKYYSLSKYFYKNAYIVILVYDITNKDSFEAIKNIWYIDIKKFGEKYQVLALVGNKADLYENEEVDEEMAREYAEKINATFMQVSARSGNNIEYLFETLLCVYLGEFQTKAKEMINEKKMIKSGTKKLSRNNKYVGNDQSCGC